MDTEEIEVDELQAEIDNVKPFILGYYSPIGNADKKEFISTRELLFEIENMVDTNMNIINKTLSQLGFKIEHIDSIPFWVMYIS